MICTQVISTFDSESQRFLLRPLFFHNFRLYILQASSNGSTVLASTCIGGDETQVACLRLHQSASIFQPCGIAVGVSTPTLAIIKIAAIDLLIKADIVWCIACLRRREG